MPPTPVSKRVGPLLAAALALSIPAGLLAQAPADAQVVRIKVLDGRNGTPITNECLDIWAGGANVTAMVAETDPRGIVALLVSGDTITAETPCTRAGGSFPTRITAPRGKNWLVLIGDYYDACQERSGSGRPAPGDAFPALPRYPVDEILSTGMVSGNTCGKIRMEPVPGELIFFERPRSFWEKMMQ